MSAPVVLTVVRHGETEWNVQQRFQGHVDVPLNARGRAQAAALARRLSADPAPGLLLTSDLLRARQTAEPLADAWRVPLHAAPAWREQGFGVLEGLDGAQIRATHPDLWQRWLEHSADFALPGGESTRDFHARIAGALQALLLRAAADGLGHVTVVTHGGVLDMLWRTAHALPLDGYRECAIPNTGVNRLAWDGGALRVLAWADAAHVKALP